MLKIGDAVVADDGTLGIVGKILSRKVGLQLAQNGPYYYYAYNKLRLASENEVAASPLAGVGINPPPKIPIGPGLRVAKSKVLKPLANYLPQELQVFVRLNEIAGRDICLLYLVSESEIHLQRLVELLGLYSNTIMRCVKKLQRAGLVQILLDPTDARLRWIKATAEGREVCRSLHLPIKSRE